MISASHEIDAEMVKAPTAVSVPLVVALDETLISTDSLLESLFILAKRKPFQLLRLPARLAQGLAQFKHFLAREAMPDVPTLPYDRELLAWLRAEKQEGRRLILATAADEALANKIAAEVGLFDEVIASDGATNLSRDRIRQRLVAEFGEKGFDYAGHSHRDRALWHAARKAILVRPSSGLQKAEPKEVLVDRVFDDSPPGLSTYLHAMRLHHWTKNALVFVPTIGAHQLYNIASLAHSGLGFLAFSFAASSVYLLNDLMDLPDDRLHPHKSQRMLASGQLSAVRAVALMPLLLLAAFAVGLLLSLSFLGALGLYCGLMAAYCLKLRAIAVVDALAVAAGYTLRVTGGSVALDLAMPGRLAIFCILFFFGLTLLKRYAELITLHPLMGAAGQARAYLIRDRHRIALFGCASGYVAMLVFGFYIADLERQAYPQLALLWVVWGLLLYWVSYMWLMAGRGKVIGDPVAFALRDRVTQIVGALALVTVLIVG
jgi:4-hydroxybenzoate polyprenyltransferase